MTVNLNVKITGYASRVLGVIKEKFGLRDKGEALDKFAELYGADYVDAEVKEEVIRDILRMDKEYFTKHPKGKAMNTQELDKITGTK